MFGIARVPALLTYARIDMDGQERRARVGFWVKPVSAELAAAIDPHLDNHRLSIRSGLSRQRLTFALVPEISATGGVVENVKVRDLDLRRYSKIAGGDSDLRLFFEARFAIVNNTVTAKLAVEYVGELLYVTLSPMQEELPFVSAEFINQRNRDGRAGLKVGR